MMEAKASDKYASPDEPGWFKGPDGCDYEDLESLIQCGIFEFCVCGNPDDNLAFIMAGLEHIESLKADVWTDKKTYDDWAAEGLLLFGSENARRFFFYWCDKAGLTEHGGSIPGWLDDHGYHALALLREWKAGLPEAPE